MKTYYCVTTTFDDHGRVTAAITDTREVEHRPQNTMSETRKADIYMDWYDSRKAALDAIEAAKRA